MKVQSGGAWTNGEWGVDEAVVSMWFTQKKSVLLCVCRGIALFISITIFYRVDNILQYILYIQFEYRYACEGECYLVSGEQ